MPKKPKRRRSSYTYFFQACREHIKARYPGQEISFADLSKCCAQGWKAMSDQEKGPFQRKSDDDKQRFDAEMRIYAPKDFPRKKKKLSKDPNAPTHPLTPYMWFSLDEQPKIKGMYPKYNVVGVGKELGRMWARVDPEDRERYNRMAEMDRQRYRREVVGYNNKKSNGGAAPMQQQRYETEEESKE